MKGLVAAFVLLAGAAASAAPAPARFDPCSLLTAREIQEVQGDRVVSTKASEPERDRFAVSQCFYTLATFSNSISLEVTRRRAGAPDDPRAHWKQTFARAVGKAREKREEPEAEERGAPTKEKQAAGPRPVPGVGEEAFWDGSSLGGGLFVLKGNAYLRLSVGGPDSEPVKIEKLKKLARKALPRLR